MPDFWVSYEKFGFSKQEIIWALAHLQEMSEGRWPDNPEGQKTYLERPLATRQQRPYADPDFIKYAGIAGEIEARLSECKLNNRYLDSYLVYGFYQYNIPYERLAKVAQMSITKVEDHIRRALDYVSLPDFWENRPSYEEFIKGGKQ